MQVRVSVAAAMWCVAAFVPTLNAQGDPVGAYQLRYAANLPLSGSVVNLTNSGANSTSPGLVGGLPQNGNLCANIYTYSPDEQLVSCCTCLLTPNALAQLQGNHIGVRGAATNHHQLPCQLQRSLDRRRERLQVSALGTPIADHPQEFLPARFDSGQPFLFDGALKPRLCPAAFEVEGHALFHRRVALGTCLRLRHHS